MYLLDSPHWDVMGTGRRSQEKGGREPQARGCAHAAPLGQAFSQGRGRALGLIKTDMTIRHNYCTYNNSQLNLRMPCG
jgi:hypothetical protein